MNDFFFNLERSIVHVYFRKVNFHLFYIQYIIVTCITVVVIPDDT